ncbi:hypothetical protein LTR96_011048 [Exophiala xenobiotica]|nr:hypothetical protein LTR41_011143 [Exophiala xenobiotica]KAK5215409.1 hypothetical protein LTR72_011532 [Exophiala xenobiotica]KAK5220801.1 hypothetical protein LTR47_011150 [Exophiala xenobiotica]KAK5245253.1 hypothetical protein LTS06_009305 [Exophiala xenobiotica]KAK5263567.1 hypothetical protein LTR96_011048 [Exophiala xenobiotica]
MAGIAGVRHAVEYEGGVVMKGFSSMFVPIKRNGDRVQWHLISSSNSETRLTYKDALGRCPERVSLEEVDLGSLRTTRAIVGWCSPVSCLLGSDKVGYKNIHYSGADNADTVLKFAGVLYDKGEKRAWLVKASEVILHLAHHRNWLEPFEIKGKRVRLPTTDQGGLSTRDILLRNAQMDLFDCEKYTFKDMVLNIWSILEFLTDQNVRRDQTPGTIIKGTLRESLHGFEFKAVAEERSPYRLKDTPIEKTSGGWLALVRDIDALVLFADGFNDIMRPLLSDDNQQLCRRWRTMPKGKDYLATSVKILKELYDVAGCRTGSARRGGRDLCESAGAATRYTGRAASRRDQEYGKSGRDVSSVG